MKRIRAKIRLWMTATVNVSLLVMAAVTIVMNYRSTLSTLENTMTETAHISAERVEMELNAYKQIAYEVGCITDLANPDFSPADKQAVIDQRCSVHGFKQGNILDMEGASIFDGTDFGGWEFFQEALKGNTYVSMPTTGEFEGEFSVVVAAPIWENGEPGGNVAGVLYLTKESSFLNDIVASLKVSDNGSAYMLDKDGYTIAHKNSENVTNRENTQEDAKTDSALADLASMEYAMTQGKSGFGQYSYGGVTKFLAYAPISGTDGWSLGINAPQYDIMGMTKRSIAVTAIVLLSALVVATILSGWLANGISRPIRACVKRMQSLVAGDLESPVMESHAKDETGLLLGAVRDLVSSLKALILDMDYMLSRMANGDFTAESQCRERYVGGFNGLLNSVNTLNSGLSETMREINKAAGQVAQGADQVSGGAQTLSQGSVEQTASTQELAATVNDISRQIDTTADFARTAKDENLQTHSLIKMCSDQMNELVIAMQDIDDKAKEIDKVIKTIDDIAFQTNIISLNASVEAERAGAAGKGFAVVAGEVRELAAKSSDAAKNTSILIEQTVHAVNKGARLSRETDQALRDVVASAQKVLDAVIRINDAASSQSQAVAQVSEAIGQIADVVQTNSATAEESAAASEELSSQAAFLKEQVDRFTLS